MMPPVVPMVVTIPVGLILITPEGELLQLPPSVSSSSCTESPLHIEVTGAVIGPGNGFTVTGNLAMHPVGSVKITVSIPALPPVMVLVVAGPGVTPALVVTTDHVPDAVSDSSVVAATHIWFAPVIAAGEGLTVSARVRAQPVGNV